MKPAWRGLNLAGPNRLYGSLEDSGVVEMMYCWRCEAELPMLDESEFAWAMEPIDRSAPRRRLFFLRRKRTAQAARDEMAETLSRWQRITGHLETNFNALWHHRVSLYGLPCKGCGRPLRTPTAAQCVMCGASS